jgi:transposase-like protein
LLLKRFNQRKRAASRKWHIEETYIRGRGRRMYLYRAIDSVGATVGFWSSGQCDLFAAKRFLRKALARHGRPDRIVIDGSQTNREAIISRDAENRLRHQSRRSLTAIRIRQSKYLNNRIEQDHRCIKRRVPPILGFKTVRGGNRYSGRHRDGSYDAKAAGSLRLQSRPFAERPVRGDRRLKSVK